MIKVVEFGTVYSAPTVLCLGRYESLHLGHKVISERAVSLADALGAEAMLMTFDGDNHRFRGVILNFSERVTRANRFGLGSILKINFNDDFMRTTAEEFLSTLKSTLNLKGIVCGFDFRFGSGRQGDVSLLQDFCKDNGIAFDVVDEVMQDGEKISTSTIKRRLAEGDVIGANCMLGYTYFMDGTVVEGRRVGNTLGFPTANVKVDSGKAMLKKGVYIANVIVDGVVYKSITNFGNAPTFDCNDFIIEAHLKGFNGNLYGKEIRVEFVEYLRGIIKFSSVEQLKQQLAKDLERLL